MAASNGLEMILNDVIVRLGFDVLKEEQKDIQAMYATICLII